MPRAAKRDIAVTEMLRANGLFLNRYSFASLDQHLYLTGEDVSQMRMRVWKKSGGLCALCRKKTLDPFNWHMHHIQGGLVGRCDCLHNLQAVHPYCHAQRHVRPQFTKKLNAEPAGD